MKLNQAVGRLLRSETDSGLITILDTRLATKAYGKLLLAGLPPFSIRLFGEEYIVPRRRILTGPTEVKYAERIEKNAQSSGFAPVL